MARATVVFDSPADVDPHGFVLMVTDDAARRSVRLHDGRDGSEYTFDPGAWNDGAPDPSVFELPAEANKTACFEPCVF